MKRSLRFRVYHFIHNCVAHPLLPLADVLMGTRFEVISTEIMKFHDNTTPPEDAYNTQKFFGGGSK